MSNTKLLNSLKHNLMKVDKKLNSFSSLFGIESKKCSDKNVKDMIQTIGEKTNECQLQLDQKKQSGGSNEIVDKMDEKLKKYVEAFDELAEIYDKIKSKKDYTPDENKIKELTRITNNFSQDGGASEYITLSDVGTPDISILQNIMKKTEGWTDSTVVTSNRLKDL